ncbi:Uncharacterised protein [[Clostridium] symbiosum]|nr:hypothetical protein HMPREF1020_03349 [Clostridium sp. 7_3_54FAA]CUO82165.1 Uncharacterised protein [[Clostridium] symbiosum]SCI60705.1 Uncharacterised protein [uncultured Clostridium sp.]
MNYKTMTENRDPAVGRIPFARLSMNHYWNRPYLTDKRIYGFC